MKLLSLAVIAALASTSALAADKSGLGGSLSVSNETVINGLKFAKDYSLGAEVNYTGDLLVGSLRAVTADTIIDSNGADADVLATATVGIGASILGNGVVLSLEGNELRHDDAMTNYVDAKMLMVREMGSIAMGMEMTYTDKLLGVLGHAYSGKMYASTSLLGLDWVLGYGKVANHYEFGDLSATLPIGRHLALTATYLNTGDNDGTFKELLDDNVNVKLAYIF